MKKLICTLLFFALLRPFSALSQESQSAAASSAARMLEIVRELQQISNEKENYLSELESINSANRSELIERESELQQRVSELSERESELKNLKLQLELFGGLIDDQATYFRSLSKKLSFWRAASGVLAASLTGMIIWAASR